MYQCQEIKRYHHGEDAWVLSRSTREWQLDLVGPRGRWRWPTDGDPAAAALRKALVGCVVVAPACGTLPMRLWRAGDVLRFTRQEQEYLWLPTTVAHSLIEDLQHWETSWHQVVCIRDPMAVLPLPEQLYRTRDT